MMSSLGFVSIDAVLPREEHMLIEIWELLGGTGKNTVTAENLLVVLGALLNLVVDDVVRPYKMSKAAVKPASTAASKSKMMTTPKTGSGRTRMATFTLKAVKKWKGSARSTRLSHQTGKTRKSSMASKSSSHSSLVSARRVKACSKITSSGNHSFKITWLILITCMNKEKLKWNAEVPKESIQE